jgi:hypothetical protein
MIGSTKTINEDVFNGVVRPHLIPEDWQGRQLKSKRGWLWYDPTNEGNRVFFYRADPDSPFPIDREPYVVVVKDGLCLDRQGNPIAGNTAPDD